MHVGQTLFLGDEDPVLVPTHIVEKTFIIDIQINVATTNLVGVAYAFIGRRLNGPYCLLTVGIQIVCTNSGVKSVDAVVVTELGVQAIAAILRDNLDVETILSHLGASSPVFSNTVVVLQPLSCLHVIKVEGATLLGQNATFERDGLSLHACGTQKPC